VLTHPPDVSLPAYPHVNAGCLTLAGCNAVHDRNQTLGPQAEAKKMLPNPDVVPLLQKNPPPNTKIGAV